MLARLEEPRTLHRPNRCLHGLFTQPLQHHKRHPRCQSPKQTDGLDMVTAEHRSPLRLHCTALVGRRGGGGGNSDRARARQRRHGCRMRTSSVEIARAPNVTNQPTNRVPLCQPAVCHLMRHACVCVTSSRTHEA